MTWTVAAGLLMIAGMGAFGVTPQALGRSAPDLAHERELLSRLRAIDARLTDDFWRRYDELVAIRKAESIPPDGPEHRELMRMTDELEGIHADRLMVLSELARLRGTTLAEVMKHGDVPAWDHG